mgnify:CR=1 FL=1
MGTVDRLSGFQPSPPTLSQKPRPARLLARGGQSGDGGDGGDGCFPNFSFRPPLLSQIFIESNRPHRPHRPTPRQKPRGMGILSVGRLGTVGKGNRPHRPTPPPPFQSLIGRLATAGGITTCSACRRFQSLIGRLATGRGSSVGARIQEFQSLIGRLATLRAGSASTVRP